MKSTGIPKTVLWSIEPAWTLMRSEKLAREGPFTVAKRQKITGYRVGIKASLRKILTLRITGFFIQLKLRLTMSSTFARSNEKVPITADKTTKLAPSKRFPAQTYYNGSSVGIAKKYGIPLKNPSNPNERSPQNHEVIQRKSTTPLKSKSGHSALRKKPSLDGIKDTRPVTKKSILFKS
jgi:hypothetical protein